MPPYFDLTVGPPPTERSRNAIESERDLRHCGSHHGSTVDYRMRRHKRPDSIPRYDDHAIYQLGGQFNRHFVFLRNDHIRIFVELRKQYPDFRQQWECSATTRRSDGAVEYSEAGGMADVWRMRQ